MIEILLSILTIVVFFLLFLGAVAAVSLLPTYLGMLAINWLAPQFGGQVHVTVWQAWVTLFLIGLVASKFRHGGRD